MQDIVPKGGRSTRRSVLSEIRPKPAPRVSRSAPREDSEEQEVKIKIHKPVKIDQIEHVHKQDVEEH